MANTGAFRIVLLGVLMGAGGCIYHVNDPENSPGSSSLPQISIVINSTALNEIFANPFAKIEKEGHVTLSYRGRDTRRTCTVEMHGGTARMFSKKSFKLDFKGSVSLGRFLCPTMQRNCAPESDDLVLLAAAADMSKLRDYLAMFATIRLGGKCPSVGFGELTINGEYYGLMILVEKITESYLRKKGSKGNHDLIKSVSWKGNMAPRSNSAEGLELKYGTLDSYAQTVGWIDSLWTGYGGARERCSDSTLLGFAAGCFFSGESDGFGKNYFYVHDRVTNTFEMIRWDANATFGRQYFGDTLNIPWQESCSRNALFEKLWLCPEWKSAVGARLRESFARGLLEDMVLTIDEHESLLQTAIQRDLDKWGDITIAEIVKYFGIDCWPDYESENTIATVSEDIELIRTYIEGIPARVGTELGID